MIAANNLLKLKGKAITEANFDANDLVPTLQTPGISAKFANKSISITSSNSDDINKMIHDMANYPERSWTYSIFANKIKSINSTDNDKAINVSRDMFEKIGDVEKYKEDKGGYTSADDVKIKGLVSDESTEATAAKETFVFTKETKNFTINNFGSEDKINIQDPLGSTFNRIMKFESGDKLRYNVSFSLDNTSGDKNIVGLGITKSNKTVVFEKKADKTNIYSVADTNGDGIVQADEISLLGSVSGSGTSGFHPGASDYSIASNNIDTE